MKKYIKILIPCLILAMGLSGCYDLMDSKDSVDSKFALNANITVSVSSAEANGFSSASIQGTVNSIEDVIETGIMVSSSTDFSAAAVYAAKEVGTSFTIALSGLTEATTYNVKAYAYLADGQISYSDVRSFTTPVAPVFELAGVYSATEYDAKTGEISSSYDVTVSFVNGSETEVELTNFWEGGMTVTGVYDKTTGVVTIPTNQVIYVHPSYGEVKMVAVNDAISAYAKAVTCQFTAKGGFLNTSTWGAICSAGAFGYAYVKMAHK